MMSETKQCTRCDGDGMLWADGKAHYPGHKGATVMCSECGGAGHFTTPDPPIAAAEEMAKALEAAHAFIYGDMGDYGVRPDYEDDKALNIIDSALAAWNALK